MIKTKANGDKITVTELVSLLPAGYLEAVAVELAADKWVRQLKASVVFKLVLFSILNEERLSLRTMQDNYEDPLFQAMAAVSAGDKVGWTGIRERLIHLKTGYCRKLYETVYEQAKQHYGVKSLSGYHLKRYDSTMIASFAHLLQGMQVGNTDKGKTQVKLTTEMSGDFLIAMDFHSDQAHLSEETALQEAVEKAQHHPDEVSVFDKGLKSRSAFGRFAAKGTRFIGRLHGSPRYRLHYPLWQDNGLSDTEELEFVQDAMVYLYESGQKEMEIPLRLVQFRRKTDGQLLSFVSNVEDISAAEIAAIYRCRWDIEVLFRFMKQEMNLTHFVCNEQNAIEVMLYLTMITSMLVLVYKKQNGIKSYKRAKQRFYKELFYSFLLDIIESPQDLEAFKKNAKTFIKKE